MSDSKDRLEDLRIDREEGDGSPWPRRLVLLAMAVLAVVAAGWWFVGRERAVQVAVAAVSRSEAGRAAVSVLDASGYVTARRQAAVSGGSGGRMPARCTTAMAETPRASAMATQRSALGRPLRFSTLAMAVCDTPARRAISLTDQPRASN